MPMTEMPLALAGMGRAGNSAAGGPGRIPEARGLACHQLVLGIPEAANQTGVQPRRPRPAHLPIAKGPCMGVIAAPQGQAALFSPRARRGLAPLTTPRRERPSYWCGGSRAALRTCQGKSKTWAGGMEVAALCADLHAATSCSTYSASTILKYAHS